MTVLEFSAGWTCNRLADGLGVDRRTAARRLREASVAPIGKRGRFDIYDLSDAARAILSPTGALVSDPSTLPPLERRAYYQSENERLKVEVSAGALIPAPEVEDRFADLVKTVSQFFDTLPDVLERDCGITPEQVIQAQASCDRVRQALYQAVVADAGEADETNINNTEGAGR